MSDDVDFIEPHRGECGGVPVFWAEGPAGLPFVGALLFRVGYVDESLHTRGITHLVEHLALPGAVGAAVDYNGAVDPTSTTFWASGARNDVLAFLTEIGERLVDPPLERLERERSILLTEAASHNFGHPGGALALRYGARGPGLAGHDELGLHRLSAGDVSAWAETRFVAENAALYLTGPPPDSFELQLPRGARQWPSPPQPSADVRYPSVFGHGPDDSVALSFVATRATAMTVGMNVLNERVRERMRFGHGMTYEVGSWFEPLTAELAHHVIWADCLPENAAAARGALLTELDELAHTGPTDDERRRDLDEFDRWASDRSAIPSVLWAHAHAELLGQDLPPPAGLREERLNTTQGDVAETLTEAARTLLLVQPEGVPTPAGRFTRYPESSPTVVEGRRLRRSGLSFRQKGIERSLVLGNAGVTLECEGSVRTVRFDDLAAAIEWSDGSRTLYAQDGWRIHVDPTIWRRGADAIQWIDERSPKELRIVVGAEDEALADPDVRAAEVAVERGDHEGAVTLLEAAQERWPASAPIACKRAESLLALNRAAEALGEADRAAALAPADSWAARLRMHSLRALGRVRESLEAGREMIAGNPSDLEALADFAWYAAEAGADAEAARAADRAVELYPDVDYAWFAKGWAALHAGEWSDAETALRRAMELDTKNSMWRNNFGWFFLSTGRPKEALEHFTEALKLDRSNPFARKNRVHALRRLARTSDADREWRELHESRLAELGFEPSRDDAVAATEFVRTLVALGRDHEALEAARSAVESHPQHLPLLQHLVGGETLWGDPARAAELVDLLLQLDETDPQSLETAAWHGWVTRDAEAVRRLAEHAEREGVGWRTVSFAHAYALLTESRPSEALAAFTSILARTPLDCCAHAGLGFAQLELGDRPAAAAAAAEAEVWSATRCQDARLLRERLAA